MNVLRFLSVFFNDAVSYRGYTASMKDGLTRMESWWNILTGENRSVMKKTWPITTLSTTKLSWIGLGSNSGLRDERPLYYSPNIIRVIK
jgi:hypothetical protein